MSEIRCPECKGILYECPDPLCHGEVAHHSFSIGEGRDTGCSLGDIPLDTVELRRSGEDHWQLMPQPRRRRRPRQTQEDE